MKQNQIQPQFKKTIGFDLIISEMQQQLQRKGIVMLTYLIDATCKIKQVPRIWKVSEMIVLKKQINHEIIVYPFYY